MEKLQLDQSTFSVYAHFLLIDSEESITALKKEEVEELIKYLQDSLEYLR